MQVKDIAQAIEDFAPLQYQENYDNCGIQLGTPINEVTGVLITLDVTEDVVDEAIERGCNMIVSHHPLLFSGLKQITGSNYVERVVIKAIRNNINIYSSHTCLDNMLQGVNATIAEKLGLVKTRILAPKANTLSKLYTYAPIQSADKVRDALFNAGAGHISKYKECSFNTTGMGTFRADLSANPAIGVAGGTREIVEEIKIEVIVEKHAEKKVLRALFDSHPYEEVAYELIPLPNTNQDIGAGIIGVLPLPVSEVEFLTRLKQQMKVSCIRHTPLSDKQIEHVAICGGSGSFLLKDAIKAGADIFITGDFKYHQFFDAEGQIIIADIGHFESEQFTSEIFARILTKKFPNFAILLSNINTNPIQYFC